MVREETKQEKSEEESIDANESLIPPELNVISPEQSVVPKITIAEGWTPKTKLGMQVASGRLRSIDEIFEQGIKITEPGIVDTLLPNLQSEIILIGGSTGKGGGIRRTPQRRTTRMHKSGRRYTVSVMVVVGNENGYIGIGLASGPPGKNRDVIVKALNKAKLNIIPVRRGCGSWECVCGTNHSIPFEVIGRAGSVTVKLMPAPKGVGLVVNNEVKKLIRLAGIRDVWCKSRGQTGSRVNLFYAFFDAIKNIGSFRTKEEYEKSTGMSVGGI